MPVYKVNYVDKILDFIQEVLYRQTLLSPYINLIIIPFKLILNENTKLLEHKLLKTN